MAQKRSSPAVSMVLALALVAHAVPGFAQTKITAPKNSFTAAQDAEIGQKAAAEVREQMPLVRDEDVQNYVDRIGDRLVAALPAEWRHPEFKYSFQVVNARDINAFALPGGPMFVNRGMIAAARSEGEVAGVMAHELSHVALRHGTAQATKAQKYQFGQLAGAIVGAVVGGTAGQVIAQGSQFGLGAAFLRYSREYEKQADLAGAQIMARAGYEPRAMAAMFRTIQQRERSRAPQFLSAHPDPGNRVAYITTEAEQLEVRRSADTGQLKSIQAELQRLPPAPTTEQLMQNAQAQQEQRGGTRGSVGTSGGGLSEDVAPPSSDFATYDVENLFSVSVPANWRQLPGDTSVTFAPEGAFGSVQDASVFSHGVEIGVTPTESEDLRAATEELVQVFTQSNPQLRRSGSAQVVRFAGRQGLQLRLRNTSDVTGSQEVVVLTTALMGGGNLIYSLGVAPQQEFSQYRSTLQRVNESVQLK